MFSADFHSERGFTVETTTLPESPGTVLLNDTVAALPDADVAGVLLALVRDCDAFNPSPEVATVVICDDGVELRFDHKDLRMQFHCEDTDSVTWPMIQDQLYEVPAGTEWLVIATGPLTARARAEIDYANFRDGIHYIEISSTLRWRRCD
ncbi:hypothetical protein [Haloarcula amylovorans]|uniref:hypothetical protein n=1 Tax=Haloarcula amylovorans TaxID=2562280 RepID=UPI001076540F|nr:hypothetical protein [Halomicroarcula amylolytica]